MADRTEVTALDYATAVDAYPRRDRVVERAVAVGALALAAFPLLDLIYTILLLRQRPGLFSQLDGWAIAYLISFVQLPMLFACAALALRWSSAPDQRRRLIIACSTTLLVAAFFALVQDVRLWATDAAAGSVESPVYQAAIQASGYAKFLFLLMPMLLLNAPDARRWRNRALTLAALAALLSGLGGVDVLRDKGYAKQRVVGGTFSAAVQAALREPMPIAGLWPIAGMAGAGLLVVAISNPRAPAIGFALCLVVAFRVTYAYWQWAPWDFPALAGRLAPVVTLVELSRSLICDLLPVAVVAWALWRDRDHLLEGAEPTLAHWATNPS
jgi:hypothetical protein